MGIEAIIIQNPASSENIARLAENHRKFLHFVSGRVDSRQDAEEILQAAYVRAAQRGGSIQNDESVVAWFYRLLRNAMVDHYRHRDVKRRAMEAVVEQAAYVDPELDAAVCQCIYDLLPNIRGPYRDLIQRIDLDDASIAEVAAETGMTPNNTRVKLHRARVALRKQLVHSCGICAEHGCLDCSCKRKRSDEM